MKRYRKGLGGLLADLHQDFRFEIAGALFVLGLFLVIIAALGYVPQARSWVEGVAVLGNIVTGLGPWIFWETIIASVVMLIGGLDFADTIKKSREFEKLINTTSKEVFLKNRKRIVALATEALPERYWRRMERKRLELKVRD
ncbi:MAG: DUF3198 domain-containing protein [Methanobacteriota archaeon]|nr:MAG: DUF3198 domain-containing protein [Euryarchaeota archaeon]